MKILLAFYLGLSLLAFAHAEDKSSALRKRVTDFCQTEFKGDDDGRATYLEDSVKEKYVVDFRVEPVDVVTSFQIVSIDIKGDLANVIVTYDVIGQFRNVSYSGYPNLKKPEAIPFKRADRFLAVHMPQFRQRSTWKLDHSDGQWYLVHSGIPKVSRDGLLEVIQKEITLESEIIRKDPTPHTPSEYCRMWNEEKVKALEALQTEQK